MKSCRNTHSILVLQRAQPDHVVLPPRLRPRRDRRVRPHVARIRAAVPSALRPRRLPAEQPVHHAAPVVPPPRRGVVVALRAIEVRHEVDGVVEDAAAPLVPRLVRQAAVGEGRDEGRVVGAAARVRGVVFVLGEQRVVVGEGCAGAEGRGQVEREEEVEGGRGRGVGEEGGEGRGDVGLARVADVEDEAVETCGRGRFDVGLGVGVGGGADLLVGWGVWLV